MSIPRYGWWGYVKWMIRSYKGGALATKEEREAVEAAISETRKLPDGAERLRLVDLIFWRKTHVISGAALELHISERTAREWHRQFIRLVAKKRGLI